MLSDLSRREKYDFSLLKLMNSIKSKIHNSEDSRNQKRAKYAPFDFFESFPALAKFNHHQYRHKDRSCILPMQIQQSRFASIYMTLSRGIYIINMAQAGFQLLSLGGSGFVFFQTTSIKTVKFLKSKVKAKTKDREHFLPIT